MKALAMDEDFLQPLPHPELPNVVWPAPVIYAELCGMDFPKPTVMVANLLESSSRMLFGGGSKTFKTWAMCDLAVSIAAGVPFWGFDCLQCACLYVNFELKAIHMRHRLAAIIRAKKLGQIDLPLYVWNLRSYDIPLQSFKAELLTRIEQSHALVVFVDPFYKLLGFRDERVSSEINFILAVFEEINRLSNASIVCAAHFTKGNQAAKDSIDRISGGGAINRDPDTLLTLTKHETDEAFTVDFTMRDFSPIAPFVVTWNYPLLVRSDLDPDKIKRPGRPKLNGEELFKIIKAFDDQLDTDQLLEKAGDLLNWSRATFYRKLDELAHSKRIYKSLATDKWNLKPS